MSLYLPVKSKPNTKAKNKCHKKSQTATFLKKKLT